MKKVFKSPNHLFNYCRAIIYNKSFDTDLDEQQLLDICIDLFTFNKENSNKILEKCLRDPTNLFSYTLSSIEDETRLSKYLEVAKSMPNVYENLFKMSVSSMCSNVGVYNTYIEKALAAASQDYYLEYIKGTGLYNFEKYNEDFISELGTLTNKPGIYKFYDKNKKLIYIGKSYNLSNRLLSSSKSKPVAYYSYSIIDNKADADIYELYYIEKEKPEWNSACKNDDTLTIKIPEIQFTGLKPLLKEVTNIE